MIMKTIILGIDLNDNTLDLCKQTILHARKLSLQLLWRSL
jgi:hypothetical protein